jgi:AraC-like DNA-binding protein
MDPERLVDDYNAAWNSREADRLLALMDKRAAYYDAFWMEYVSGRDLAQYLRDSMEDESYWYQRVGQVLLVSNGVVCRYSASEHLGDGQGDFLFQGAEVFSFRSGKIITISDYYCSPLEKDLEEVALYAARHHGETRQAEAGLSALRALRFRRRLLDVVLDQQIYLDPDLSQSGLAAMVGCSVEHLTQVIDSEFGTNFHNFVDRYRINHAKQLMLGNGSDLANVAKESGYPTEDEFVRAFKRISGQTPTEFRQRGNDRGIGI